MENHKNMKFCNNYCKYNGSKKLLLFHLNPNFVAFEYTNLLFHQINDGTWFMQYTNNNFSIASCIT